MGWLSSLAVRVIPEQKVVLRSLSVTLLNFTYSQTYLRRVVRLSVRAGTHVPLKMLGLPDNPPRFPTGHVSPNKISLSSLRGRRVSNYFTKLWKFSPSNDSKLKRGSDMPIRGVCAKDWKLFIG